LNLNVDFFTASGKCHKSMVMALTAKQSYLRIPDFRFQIPQFVIPQFVIPQFVIPQFVISDSSFEFLSQIQIQILEFGIWNLEY